MICFVVGNKFGSAGGEQLSEKGSVKQTTWGTVLNYLSCTMIYAKIALILY